MKNFKVYNKERYHWEVPLFIGFVICFFGILFKKMDYAIFVQLCIFTALLWYSFETRENNKIEQKPIVDLYFRPVTSEHKEYFRLRNTGKGVAYNINVESIIIDKIDNSKYIFSFRIKDPNLMLAPLGDEKTLDIFCETIAQNNNRTWISDVRALNLFKDLVLAKEVANFQNVKFIISFENINRKKFERIFRFFYDKTDCIHRVKLEK